MAMSDFDVPHWPAPDSLFTKQDTPAFTKAENKAHRDGLEPCTHCGRGVAKGSGFMTVVMGGGSYVINPESVTPEMECDSGYMGAWILGSSCIRQIPAGARQPW